MALKSPPVVRNGATAPRNRRREVNSSSEPDVAPTVAASLSDRPAHFSLVRSFHLADFLTLGNGVCGMTSILCSMKYLVTDLNDWYLWVALILIPVGAFLDVLDGRVARWRQKSSLLGQELDSLADLVSFGVAPAAVGFALGLQTNLDIVAMVYFVACGISRLARYNATVASLPKDSTGKIHYFEGTPIPTSIAIVGLFAYLVYIGRLGPSVAFGEYHVGGGFTYHPLVLLYVFSGTTMISQTLRIPKL
ncbi:CDP-diacylglycerol-serine O-phosphatidyltransferase [Tieghemiomyces parasiticus]|uniref:CDP-diacylglycerol--serine O-phosphatidyltransferase n=1 Tax=Tieghemiomyces parasiticus TaxID=78921 RepID=A0A9W7ZWW3_9FUNG|nr:CDP-diacylglycerol-serine O-phosphatidyltransferase [Tieghemiomyces parasiticus]